MKNLVDNVCKRNNENALYMIIMAIILASAIIFAAWLTRGSENSEAIFLILITVSSSIFFIGRNRRDD